MTIYALSTGPGISGIAIIRINPNAISIEEETRINHLVIGSNTISRK